MGRTKLPTKPKSPLEKMFDRIDNPAPGTRLIISRPLGTVNIGIKEFKRQVAHLPKGTRNKLIREYKAHAWEKIQTTITGLRGKGKTRKLSGRKKQHSAKKA